MQSFRYARRFGVTKSEIAGQFPIFPLTSLDSETVAAIIRITGGNFRFLNRLLTQMEGILETNSVDEVTKAVVEEARERVVIGQSYEI
jgi:DNA transposition AAA+ family ATPase